MRALLAALLLGLVAFAVPPAEARQDPPQCVHGGIEQSVGPATVRTTCGEGIVVEVKPYDCVWGGYWEETHVGPVTYRQYKCGPDGG